MGGATVNLHTIIILLNFESSPTLATGTGEIVAYGEFIIIVTAEVTGKTPANPTNDFSPVFTCAQIPLPSSNLPFC